MKNLFNMGVEKVAVNTYAVENPSFIREAADTFGSQSIIVSLDVKKSLFGKYSVHTHGGRKNTGRNAVECAVEMEKAGAGELLLSSIDRDGTMQGYDLELIKQVTSAVSIPVVACGGAGNAAHLVQAVLEGGASAAAAGSMFVFQGPHRAVLISYPNPVEMNEKFEKGI